MSEMNPPNTVENVLQVFADINASAECASKTQIFELAKLFRIDPKLFEHAWEQAYLKIFKIFHEKANRKMPPKYEKLATSFFSEILNSKDDDASKLFNFFLQFLAQAVFSSITGLRITAARMLFQHLQLDSNRASPKVRSDILKSIFYLLRLKVSTYKQMGIKLASQVLQWQDPIRDKVESELFKIMAVQDNEQIRKLALTNIWLTNETLPKVLIRLRDTSAEMRVIVLKKLLGEKIRFRDMLPQYRLRLLYDGYGNKQTEVQQETLQYFSRFFTDDHTPVIYREFIEFMQPDLLLLHPHIYVIFQSLLTELVNQLPIDNLAQLVRKICQQIKHLAKGEGYICRELIWLKHIMRAESSQLRSAFEEYIPSGTELAKCMLTLVAGQDLFSISECIQLFALQKSVDEMGRNKMFDALRQFVVGVNYFQPEREITGYDKDDICEQVNIRELQQKKLLLSYFDLPPISNSFDLIAKAATAMKALWPEHYQIQLKQMMSDWYNPQENTLLKEKETAMTNIKKLQAQGDTRLIQTLKGKINAIDLQLENQNTKTKCILMSLSRLKPNTPIDEYMPIIRDQLTKVDQSQGLVLLALYCLDAPDRVETFLPLYWLHFKEKTSTKIHIMTSLKSMTDFAVRFDLSSILPTPENNFTFALFIQRILQLIISVDHDIRILAIQSLCRLLYHGRIPEPLRQSCLVWLLFLWWETSASEVSARAVHTISIFVRQFQEKGLSQVRKMSQAICIYFKVLLLAYKEGFGLNKLKITYNLKSEQFLKRSLVISMTVLKYQKESRQVIWRYQQEGAELGPQELYLLFLMKEQVLLNLADKALVVCDFMENAPLQTLILVKQRIEQVLRALPDFKKKQREAFSRLEKEIEEKIQVKREDTFNEELLNGLKNELHEYELLIEGSAHRIKEELKVAELLIEKDIAMQDDFSESEESVKEEAQPDSSQEEPKAQRKEESRSNRRKLNRISEKYDDQQMEISEEKGRKKNRKRLPSPISSESEMKIEGGGGATIISHRTRSRHQV